MRITTRLQEKSRVVVDMVAETDHQAEELKPFGYMVYYLDEYPDGCRGCYIIKDQTVAFNIFQRKVEQYEELLRTHMEASQIKSGLQEERGSNEVEVSNLHRIVTGKQFDL